MARKAKERRRPRDWAKLYDRFFTSPSHLGLSRDALLVGCVAMVLANASETWGSVRTIGAASPALQIANRTRMTREEVLSALAELVQVGTVNLLSDGTVEFPKFADWQESPSAKRMQKHRSQKRHSDAYARARAPLVSGLSTISPSGSDPEGVQGEGSAPRAPSSVPGPWETLPAAPPAPKPELAVFAHYRTHHPRSHPKPSSKSKEWRAIAERLREGYSVDDLCAAIDGCHLTPHNLGENDRGQKYLGLELIMRTGSQVDRFAETARSPPQPVLSQREQKGHRAIASWLAKTEKPSPYVARRRE